MTDWITISTPEGEFRAFVARPAVLPAPAVVVLHEVFGVNADIRESCRELAAEGFVAVSPDLFWRQQPGLDLNHWTEAEWKKGLALYAAYDLEAGPRDIQATIETVRRLEDCTGAVGVMGYCLGGLLTFLTTARFGADAAVAYYGGATDRHLEEAAAVRSPLLMHLGEEDEFIGPEARAAIIAALAACPAVTVHTYPGQSHAFARHTGAHYDPEAAALANGRTYAFFHDHLDPAAS